MAKKAMCPFSAQSYQNVKNDPIFAPELAKQQMQVPKKNKKRPFFYTRLDTMSIQVENNRVIQGRNMVCLPEKYISGWYRSC